MGPRSASDTPVALRVNPKRPLVFAAVALAGFYLPLALLALRMRLEIVAAGAAARETALLHDPFTGLANGKGLMNRLVATYDAASIGYGELEAAYLRHVAQP